MSGHLCLKWNNHSPAFLKSISEVQSKERYCDATIACQGRYFPVHRIVLSTCSEYFEEMFERIQNPHPYIVFKDIDPVEMQLLLNYMYQGEINVVQEKLPVLIKAAEALKIKGLAVPDEQPSNGSSTGKKRSSSSIDTPQSKRRSEEKRRRRNSSDHVQLNSSGTEEFSESVSHASAESSSAKQVSDFVAEGIGEQPRIKLEPVDSGEYQDNFLVSNMREEQSGAKEEGAYANFEVAEPSVVHVKSEDRLEPENSVDPFIEQASGWSDFASGNLIQNILPSGEMGRPEDMTYGLGAEDPNTAFYHDDVQVGINVADDGSPKPSSSATRTTTGQAMQISLTKKIPPPHRHKCPVCSYTNSWKYLVKRHMRKHTGEKPFKCETCFKHFSHRGNLITHIRAKVCVPVMNILPNN